MELVIHDLEEAAVRKLYDIPEDARVVSCALGKPHRCIGCFGCWVKTPGQCVIQDGYGRMGEWIAQAGQVVIISRLTFGGYSSYVKNVLDRSISYVHPFFTKRNGEVHHKSRYSGSKKIRILFYGEDMTDEEKETARGLAAANGVNWNSEDVTVEFLQEAGL